QRDVRQLLAFVHPGHRAIVTGDEPGCVVDVPRREPVREQVRRLDHVVVDAHQDQLGHVHVIISSRQSMPRVTAVRPPSTVPVVPVMYDEAGEPRKPTTLPNSSGRAARPSGVSPNMRTGSTTPDPCPASSGFMRPARAMQLTRMP